MYVQFQFHLVRLKASENYSKNLFGLFQFHLVRLKDLKLTSPDGGRIFQFHLVRLKVFPEWFVILVVLNFNSI